MGDKTISHPLQLHVSSGHSPQDNSTDYTDNIHSLPFTAIHCQMLLLTMKSIQQKLGQETSFCRTQLSIIQWDKHPIPQSLNPSIL